MRRSLLFCLALSIVSSLACSRRDIPVDYGDDVAHIADDAWEHLLEQSPYLQNRRGILVTEFADLTEAETIANLEWSRAMLERIDAIPLEALSHDDALTLECIRFDNEIALEGKPYYWLQFPITPYSAGYLATFAQMMLAAYPFEEPDQTGMYLQLANEIADHLDQLGLTEHVRDRAGPNADESQEADRDCDVRPEGRIEVLGLELFALHERLREAGVHEDLHEADEDAGPSD